MGTCLRRSVLLVGACLAVLGATSAVLWPYLFPLVLHSQLELSESSRSFAIWRDTPVPMTLAVYFFNWTNSDMLRTKGEKPRFTEMGPYTFREFHEKVNISFHENDTVTFQQIRTWKFDPSRSNGSLDDMVTTINVPPLTAAFVTRHWGFFVQSSLSYFLSRFEQLVVTKSVREMLFDGYSDPLIAVAETLPALANVDIPFDKFGWFYTRNGSSSYDGVFNMDTGRGGIDTLGTLREWNFSNRTEFYEGHCGDIFGSAGELWPPHRNKDSISMFSSDLCRWIELPYEAEEVRMGIPAFRFSGGRSLVDNGTLDVSNGCFCGGRCLPVGVINASSCRYGSPAFVSYPHFLDADPFYASLVDGMQPKRDKHAFHITLEPRTGIPMDVAARLQINIMLQPIKHVSMFQNVPTAFFPMIWFEQTASMTADMASELRLLLLLADYGLFACLAILASGAVVIAAGCLVPPLPKHWIRRCRAESSPRRLKLEMRMKGSKVTQPLVPDAAGIEMKREGELEIG